MNRPNPKALFALIALWIAARLMQVMSTETILNWEVWEAHKLLDYGFLARCGALLAPPVMTGHLAFPADLNYTNHPYPIVWLVTALYALGGTHLCLAFVLTLRLAATVTIYRLFLRLFDSRSAWWGAALYALAPLGLSYDVNSNCIALAATVWPFAAALLIDERENRARLWLLGLAVFLAGQTSWMSLSLVPPWLALAWPAEGGLRALLRQPKARAVLAGAIASTLLFITQIVVYVPDAQVMIAYILKQMGVRSQEIPRTRMLVVSLLRIGLFVGPALCLGALLGVRARPDSKDARRLWTACLVYFGSFSIVAFVLLRFCVVERSPFAYLLFPTAALTAAALARFPQRSLRVGLAISTVATAAYIYAQYSFPPFSRASIAVSDFLKETTQPGDIVLTNQRSLYPPYASWDTDGMAATAARSDRLIRFNTLTAEAVDNEAASLGRNFGSVLFVKNPAFDVDAELNDRLAREGKLISRQEITIPPQPEPLAARMREWVWRQTGRFQDRGSSAQTEAQTATFEIYRLK